jgi:hypothetical protein
MDRLHWHEIACDFAYACMFSNENFFKQNVLA